MSTTFSDAEDEDLDVGHSIKRYSQHDQTLTVKNNPHSDLGLSKNSIDRPVVRERPAFGAPPSGLNEDVAIGEDVRLSTLCLRE